MTFLSWLWFPTPQPKRAAYQIDCDAFLERVSSSWNQPMYSHPDWAEPAPKRVRLIGARPSHYQRRLYA